MKLMKHVSRIWVLALVFTFCLIAACSAFKSPIYVGDSEFSIGGIRLGSTMNYVESVYGPPTKSELVRETGAMGRTIRWTYGTTFIMEFSKDMNGDYSTYMVKTTGNNGLKTPSGFTVGQPIWRIQDKYGAALSKSDNNYGLAASWPVRMNFKTDKKGRITEISMIVIP